MKRSLVIAIHNIRSAHNVGAILRTADGLGIDKVLLSGYSPYPPTANDTRLPHLAQRAGTQIAKTALGAEQNVTWEHQKDIAVVLEEYRQGGYKLAALEQTSDSLSLPEFVPPENLLLVVGNEVDGIEPEVIKKVDYSLEIPMTGKKESYNVAAAAAIAMYHCYYFHS